METLDAVEWVYEFGIWLSFLTGQRINGLRLERFRVSPLTVLKLNP